MFILLDILAFLKKWFKIILVIKMENAYNILVKFNKAVPEIKKSLLPLSKRSLISVDAALMLVILCEFPELLLYFEESVKAELICRGFAEYNEDKLTATSKGEILAKSFIAAIKKLNY